MIRPATLRDASYVMANLRPEDEAEVFCQLPDGIRTHELAYGMLHSGDNFVAEYQGNPVAFYGTQMINVCAYTVWALGTKHMHRALPAITNHLTRTHIPDLQSRGALLLEARSLKSHEVAHRWMHSTGAVQSGEPYVFGKNGEEFITFRWTADSFARMKTAGWRHL